MRTGPRIACGGTWCTPCSTSRARSRLLVAAASGLFLTGKVEPLGLKLEGPPSILIPLALLVLASLVFMVEGRLKKHAGQ